MHSTIKTCIQSWVIMRFISVVSEKYFFDRNYNIKIAKIVKRTLTRTNKKKKNKTKQLYPPLYSIFGTGAMYMFIVFRWIYTSRNSGHEILRILVLRLVLISRLVSEEKVFWKKNIKKIAKEQVHKCMYGKKGYNP